MLALTYSVLSKAISRLHEKIDQQTQESTGDFNPVCSNKTGDTHDDEIKINPAQIPIRLCHVLTSAEVLLHVTSHSMCCNLVHTYCERTTSTSLVLQLPLLSTNKRSPSGFLNCQLPSESTFFDIPIWSCNRRSNNWNSRSCVIASLPHMTKCCFRPH